MNLIAVLVVVSISSLCVQNARDKQFFNSVSHLALLCPNRACSSGCNLYVLTADLSLATASDGDYCCIFFSFFF